MPLSLSDVKLSLRVTHDLDDLLLARLISSATREYVAFTNPGLLPENVVLPAVPESIEVPEDAFNGVVLMVQADYDAPPEKRAAFRSAAESLWMPYRVNLGV